MLTAFFLSAVGEATVYLQQLEFKDEVGGCSRLLTPGQLDTNNECQYLWNYTVVDQVKKRGESDGELRGMRFRKE